MSSILPESVPAAFKLHEQLRTSVTIDDNARRPLLTHLTADSAWLLSIPIPTSDRQNSSRAYFHLLVDSWLKGNHVDVASFISNITHLEECAVNSIADVEDLIGIIEKTACKTVDSNNGRLDAVLVSFEYTDHMHKATLLQIDPCVPIIASKKPAEIIKSWKHFNTVVGMPKFSSDKWKEAIIKPLPEWLKIEKIHDPKDEKQAFHSAFLIIFSSDTVDAHAEVVIYTPHGIDAAHMGSINEAQPKIKTLALLHGLHAITSPMPVNLGAHNGLKVQRALNGKYWVGTHDEVSPIRGLIRFILKRQPLTLSDAFKKENEENGGNNTDTRDEEVDNVSFTDLRNGEVLVLK